MTQYTHNKQFSNQSITRMACGCGCLGGTWAYACVHLCMSCDVSTTQIATAAVSEIYYVMQCLFVIVVIVIVVVVL